MTASNATGFAGAVVGSFFGSPEMGMQIGNQIGALAFGNKDIYGNEPRSYGQRMVGSNLLVAEEGNPITRVYGSMRVGGQVIWCTRFREVTSVTKQSAKGGGSSVKQVDYIYTVSLAVGLCEGVSEGFGRVWADGNLMDLSNQTIRFYKGTEDQLADSKISAVEGESKAPAFRGLSYIVFEDLDLTPYGNRIPQINVEVIRTLREDSGIENSIKSVTLIPATGEHSYSPIKIATWPDHLVGETQTLPNVNNGTGEPDAKVALDQLQQALPNIETVVLVVSWFGDDLRAGECNIEPRVETGGIVNSIGEDSNEAIIRMSPGISYSIRNTTDSDMTIDVCNADESSCESHSIPAGGVHEINANSVSSDLVGNEDYYTLIVKGTGPFVVGDWQFEQKYNINTIPASWLVSGQVRSGTVSVSTDSEGRPVYGGTPSDYSIYQFILECKDRGLKVVFYPFVLMDIPSGNGLTDPYGAAEQGAFPWRGRITCSPAIGQPATADQTSTGASQVNSFFGSYVASDFGAWSGVTIPYMGSRTDKSYSRMICHYAKLCEQAGGVDAFMIGTELVGLTSVRDASGNFPAVSKLRDLAAEVKGLLGSGTKVSYAADWSEYHSYRPSDGSGDVYFHLDPLWSDANVDLIAIDNYLPLSDWREGRSHLDYADGYESIYDLDYLKSNVEGGEYYDWFYANDSDREAQIRTAITDGVAVVLGDSSWTEESADTDGSAVVASVTPTTGTNRLMLVHVSWESADAETVDSVTWGGQALTELGTYKKITGTVENAISIWYLLEADYQSVNNVTVNMLGAIGNNLAVVVTQFGNCEQAAPLAVSKNNFDSSDRSYSYTPVIEQGGIIISSMSSGSANGVTPDSGSVALYNSASSEFDIHISSKAVTSELNQKVTLSWDSALDRGIHVHTSVNSIDGSVKPWVFRNKDLKGWWGSTHYNRPSGTESGTATGWMPQSKPIWFTEFGCPAVDKGTNQPNVFYDPKSAESSFPHFSAGLPDDYIQRRYLEATYEYWGSTQNVDSDSYVGKMIDVDNCSVWTWDVRPYPEFPLRTNIWSDGDNYQLGHWIQGRLGNLAQLHRVVQDICNQVDMIPDIEGIRDFPRMFMGMAYSAITAPRDILAMLAVAYQFVVYETNNGIVQFNLKSKLTDAQVIDQNDIVLKSNKLSINLMRAQKNDIPTDVVLDYHSNTKSYTKSSVTSGAGITTGRNVHTVSVPLVLERNYASQLVQSIYNEMQMSNQKGTVTLPLKYAFLLPNDFVSMDFNGVSKTYRVLDITIGSTVDLSIAAVDHDVYSATSLDNTIGGVDSIAVVGPPTTLFLDVPLLTSSQIDTSPRVAAYQSPWPQEVNVYKVENNNASINTIVGTPSTVGTVINQMRSGPTDIWDNSNELIVEMFGQSLQSRSEFEVMQGANALFVEHDFGVWEVIQFVNAELIATNRYKLTKLRRGLLGTEGAMRTPVGSGANVVVVDPEAQTFINSIRGVDQTFKYGPSTQPVSDISYLSLTVNFSHVALRPYAPVNVSHRALDDYLEFNWTRRSRGVDDVWNFRDLPINEVLEEYEIDVYNGANVVRTIRTLAPLMFYYESEQIEDFGSVPSTFTIRVYQMSAEYGRGEYAQYTYT